MLELARLWLEADFADLVFWAAYCARRCCGDAGSFAITVQVLMFSLAHTSAAGKLNQQNLLPTKVLQAQARHNQNHHHLCPNVTLQQRHPQLQFLLASQEKLKNVIDKRMVIEIALA